MDLYYTEIGGVFFAVLYIIAAAREKNICWLWAIISSLLWAHASYFHFHLYIDALLQLFFVVTAFYGIYEWKYGGDKHNPLEISKMKPVQHVYIIVPGIILSIAAGKLFANYTQAASTYLDAFATIFSIINTFILVRKKIENWIYWIVIDTLMAYLFFIRGAFFFSGLNVLYVILSVDGYIKWNKAMGEVIND